MFPLSGCRLEVERRELGCAAGICLAVMFVHHSSCPLRPGRSGVDGHLPAPVSDVESGLPGRRVPGAGRGGRTAVRVHVPPALVDPISAGSTFAAESCLGVLGSLSPARRTPTPPDVAQTKAYLDPTRHEPFSHRAASERQRAPISTPYASTSRFSRLASRVCT